MKVISRFSILLLLISIHTLGDVIVLASDDGPPHMIKSQQSGIDLDITREVLESMGHSVNMEFYGLGRGKLNVTNGQVDAVTPWFVTHDEEGFYVSDPIVRYRPTVFSLRKHNYKIQSIADLKDKRILTFQGATGYFGDEFKKLSQSAKYKELHDMSLFPNLLTVGRYDVVILDYYIFYYFHRKHDLKNNITIFDEHHIIPEVAAAVGFHSKALRNAFNDALEVYLKSGRDKKVVEKYIGKTPIYSFVEED